MNKSQIVWGVICLVIAAVLAVLNLTLPADSFMFQIGDRNMPVGPAGCIGGGGYRLTGDCRKERRRNRRPQNRLNPGRTLRKRRSTNA